MRIINKTEDPDFVKGPNSVSEAVKLISDTAGK